MDIEKIRAELQVAHEAGFRIKQKLQTLAMLLDCVVRSGEQLDLSEIEGVGFMVQDAADGLWNSDETGVVDRIDRACDQLEKTNHLRIVEV